MMYEKFYNLKARPFRLSPDPRFLFRSKVHTKALAYLSYGLQAGEGFIVITGLSGVLTGAALGVLKSPESKLVFRIVCAVLLFALGLRWF